jgi:alpha-L-rhamnosidase
MTESAVGRQSATWISPLEPERAQPGQRPVWQLRGSFSSPAAPVRATLTATARGIYECFINGTRVGDLELTPGFTAYKSRLQVQTYDVTNLVGIGGNTLGILLSDGWHRGQIGIFRAHSQWGDTVAALAQLNLEFADGTTAVVGTDGTWQSRPSGMIADLIAGQSIDFTAWDPAWCASLAAGTGWDSVTVADHGYDNLVTSPAPPVRRVEELAPVSITRIGRGQVVDFGQNINGWVRLTNLGPAGTSLTLTHGEMLGPDGTVNQTHLMVDLPFMPAPLAAGMIDHVVSAGREGDVFEPRHTTHGFQYVQIDGHPDDLSATDPCAVVVHTDLTRTGWFECSDDRLNKLHDAAVWSFRGNSCDIPTDCPTRERAGWTGDWQLYVSTAAYLYDVAGFSQKWLRDVAVDQFPSGVIANISPCSPAEAFGGPVADLHGSAGWGDATVIVPWELYRAYGDMGPMAEQWPSMVAWMAFVERTAADRRHPTRAAARPVAAAHERYLWDAGFHWGEWLAPGEDLLDFAAFKVADKADTATAFYCYSAGLMAKMAALLGRHDEAAHYQGLSDGARAAWVAEFVTAAGEVYPATQANCVRALTFNLVPTEMRSTVAAQLVQLIGQNGNHLGTGFLATPDLLPTLADHGYLDVAYELLFQNSPPSWLAMIERGATTVWERWEGIDDDGVPHDSLNHYSKGAVISFLHRYVAGLQLDPAVPAYRRFRVQPRPGGGITSAHARLNSPHGRIEVAWVIEGSELLTTITVPVATTAVFIGPDGLATELAEGHHQVRSQLAW